MNNGRMWILVVLMGVLFAVAARVHADEPASAQESAAGPDAQAAAETPLRPWNSVDEPWRLIPRIEPLRLDIYGWAELGYTYNAERPSSGFNGVVVFNDRSEDVVPNQLYLIVERPLEGLEDPSDLHVDFGGRIDAFIGYDTRFTEPIYYGPERWNDERTYGGVDFPQVYLQGGVAGEQLSLTVTGGRFYWPGAYETPMAPDNFFYSHSYSMAYGQPKTLTGGLARLEVDLPLGSEAAAYCGVHRGWDNIDRHPLGNDTGYLYGLELQSDWGRGGWDTSLGFTFIESEETANPFIPGVKDGAEIYTVVLSQEIWDRFAYGFEYVHGEQETGSPFDGLAAPWESQTHYITAELTREVSVGLRYEVFDDSEGSRVGGIGSREDGSSIVPFGFKGEFTGIAYGVNWTPTANVTVRSEVRRDSFDGISGFGPRPFDDGTSDHQTLYCTDVIFLF